MEGPMLAPVSPLRGRRLMRQACLAVSAVSLLALPTLADEAAGFTDALGKAATGVTLAEAYVAACDARFPESRQARQDAIAGWEHKVDRFGYYRVLEAAFERLPGLEAELEEQQARAKTLVEEDVAKDGAICSDLVSELNDDAVFDIEQSIGYLLRHADDFGIVVAEAAAAISTNKLEVVPLVALSAQLAGKMDEIGSKPGARENHHLRMARESHAEAWLAQRPALLIYGRIIGDDSLREWRGDRQSTFGATCRSFADDAEALAMASAVDQNRIVAGEIRGVREDSEGGLLNLSNCRILAHAPAEVGWASLDDETAGMMPRPPQYEEVFAGPDKGISLSEVDRVLYQAEFSSLMDGFGNGYVAREEDIYVLLRDGTAYRHTWNFPFTDLDLDVSRQREQAHWFTWRSDGGTLTLTQTGGPDAGAEIDVSDARRLVPAPPGYAPDQTYYFLNIGVGGARSDREYAFSPDGTLRHSRGGFVAGNFGTSYIIAAGDGDDAVSVSNYAFDGYTLRIDGPQGEERHFAALLDGHDTNRPQEIIIDGQVHWLREDEQ